MAGRIMAAVIIVLLVQNLASRPGDVLAAGQVDENRIESHFITLRSGDMEWQTAAEFPGLEFVLLVGNPNQAGPYILRARFAPTVFTRPHFHSQDRHVTVLSGVWYAGTDASFDKNKAVALYPGDYMKHPAGGVHYDGAGDVEAIVQITGIGPVTTTGVPIKARDSKP